MSNIIIQDATDLEIADKKTYLPIDLYLPEELKENQFFKTINILLSYTENNLKRITNGKYANIEQIYKDIIYKYKDIQKLSEEALRLQLIENGFGQILDMLNLPLDKLQMIVSYLPLFKMLKGTDVGYRLLLSLLAYDYQIVSWLEDPVHYEEFTYEIAFITFLNVGFDATIVQRLSNFSRHYVYPVLLRATVKVMFRSLTPAVYGRPIIKKCITLKCFDGPPMKKGKIPVYGRRRMIKKLVTRCLENA